MTIDLNDYQFTAVEPLGHEIGFYLQSSNANIQINTEDKRIIVSTKLFGSAAEAGANRNSIPVVLRIEGENYLRFLAQLGQPLFEFFSAIAMSVAFIQDYSEIVETTDKDGNVIKSERKVALKNLSEVSNLTEVPVSIEIPDELLK